MIRAAVSLLVALVACSATACSPPAQDDRRSASALVPGGGGLVPIQDIASRVHGGGLAVSGGKLANSAPYSQPWQSGRYYFIPNMGSVSTSVTLGNGTLRATPFWVPSQITVERIGSEVTVVGDAASVLRLGIYADDGTGRPGSLVVDAGTISGNSATVQEITGLSVSLSPGVYWAAAVVQLVTTTQPTVRTQGSAGILPNIDIGTTIPSAGLLTTGVDMTGVTGALPGTFVWAADVSAVPRMFLKVH